MSSFGTFARQWSKTKDEVQAKYVEEGKLTKDEIYLYEYLKGRSNTATALGAVVGGVGGYMLIKRKRPTWGVAARMFGVFGCSQVASVMAGAVAANSAALQMSRAAPGKEKVFNDMIAEIRQRVDKDFQQQRLQSRLPPSQSNDKGNAYEDFGTDRQLGGGEAEVEVEPESSPLITSVEERRPTEPSPIIAETKSSWDKVRTQAENSMETQQSKMRFPEKRRGVEKQVDTRSQEQKDFDALLEKERQGIDD